MDINTVRAVLTLLSLVLFLAIVYWAYRPRGQQRFDDAASLPFADEDMNRRSTGTNSARGEAHHG